MKNYETYSVGQFLEDSFFVEWVSRETPESVLFWTQWQQGNPSNLDEFKSAEIQLRAIFSVKRIRPFDEDAGIVWQRIEKSIQAKPIIARWSQKKYWMAAASVLVIVFAGFMLLLQDKQVQSGQKNQPVLANDIHAPDANRATVTMADGSIVYLDSAFNGQLAMQGGTTLVKMANGQIGYKTTDQKGQIQEPIFNTLSNPRGSRVISISLADGSVVWLNAGSSITYPVAFVGEERRVELMGEGYFEVAKKPGKPFFVKARSIDVKVLGTHFNVNAFRDAPIMKVTLVEGAVKVQTAEGEAILKPLQQASVSSNGTVGVKNNVNIEEVLAWKEGKFYFDNISLKELMQQIERWYDVEAVFEKTVPDKRFTGKMYMNDNLSDVLKVLEVLDVHFKIEGKKIIVTQ